MAKLLIIEDEPRMVGGLRDNFEYEGYEVITAEDGSEGLKRALSEVPDLILLDVMLPKISGLDVCLDLKAKRPSVPIIMLTARCQVSDRVVGLELGADDYVTKPFSISELSARVKALLRRVRSDPKHTRTDGSLCQPKSDPNIPTARAKTKPFLNRSRSFRSLIGSRIDRFDLSAGRNNIRVPRESNGLDSLFAQTPPLIETDDGTLIGQQLGHYRILSRIGRGGMGVVYMALDERLHRRVALKKLNMQSLASKTPRNLLLEEARNASFLNHPSICTIYDIAEVGNEVYMVMELVDGQPLSRLIGKSGLPAKDVVHYGIQIADALVHAHAYGVIHRDLKSLNIIIRRDGLVKVLEFGLSARVGNDAIDAVTRSLCLQNDCCVVVGTIPYLAPEALKGQRPNARSDIWSFGVLLYELVTGQLPFQGETVFSLSAAILHQSPAPLPPRAPSKLRDVVERCLSKDANQRYQRFDEVAEQMRMIEQLA